MAFRFIHASDLHIGRKFANIPQPPDGNIRGRLMEARHGAIGKLADAARSRGAKHVLLAGDTFDTATPSPAVIRQAVVAMGEDKGITWWLLPGNHDNLRDAEPLWETIAGNAPGNVIALTAPEPRDMGKTRPCCPARSPSASGASDPSEPLVTMASDEGKLRIGLAHGGVTDFTESGASIAPDRDRTARLDYLALGDWHGRMAVSDRVQYSGSPEQDRFKHNRRGVCLCIDLDGPGAQPQVDEIEVGTFLWSEVELPLHPASGRCGRVERDPARHRAPRRAASRGRHRLGRASRSRRPATRRRPLRPRLRAFRTADRIARHPIRNRRP